MSKKSVVIRIGADGSITKVHSDEINFHKHGEVCIKRASEVSFDNALGGWVVDGVLPETKALDIDDLFDTREEAINAEVQELSHLLRNKKVVML